MNNKYVSMTAVATASLLLSACGGSENIDPKTWTCQSLVKPVIDMSKSRSTQILEIGSISQEPTFSPNEAIGCTGRAETSQGTVFIDYGAHVSDGGAVMVEYQVK
jgi:hypothetical protein